MSDTDGSRGRDGHPRLRRSTAGAVLLVALLLQSFLVQIHRHQAPLPFATIRADGTGHLAAARNEAGDAACPLCAEVARAGHYLASAPPRFPVPPALLFGAPPTAAFAVSATVRRMHGWLSRAPPAFPTRHLS